uniref:Tc1-like transposase DDE domain-containing protein n=1 Tax=Ditylenchus dipsaci TaxID=166011 RepID=A0A915EP47_9BILA
MLYNYVKRFFDGSIVVRTNRSCFRIKAFCRGGKVQQAERAHHCKGYRRGKRKRKNRWQNRYPKSVIVLAGITSTGKTPLVFVEEGVKVNGANYREKILGEALLPWARRHSRRRHWCLQQVFFQFLSFTSFQDSVPAHKARETQAWCRNNFSELIDVKQWPPYSTDLNPLDYLIWGILEAKVSNRRHRGIAQFKTAVQEAWEEIDEEVLASVVDNWRRRLNACVQANSGYIEK